MEQKFKSLIYNKIPTFIFLTWICHSYIYMSRQSKSLVECYNQHRRLYAKNYRLLAIYKQDKDSSIVYLKKEIPNRVNNINDMFNNEKYSLGIIEQLNGSSQGNKRRHQKDMKNKSCIFETKKYSHLEKKIFKELDYIDFLKNNKTISGKIYKKITLKKYGLRIALPIILFLLLITVLVLDLSWGLLKKESIWKAIGLGKEQLEVLEGPLSFILEPLSKLEFFKHNTLGGATASCSLCASVTSPELVSKTCILGQLFGLLIYVIPFFILGVTVISAIFFYHKKVKKYEKIKFKKQ
ncbi:fam-l protein [Plasmodium brasilianum]|uniref:Fam-l protein n=1 Tax=Plasmodium malariae TaxID=5858 RepID=A0A1D3JI20_PLAMA|nr:fam-l protein [Plasmodium malariae]KAI4841579.1 fam-l protein [Plasmodium brasilianum]SBT85902.1 fam-l protein [Plasmodium malariae]